MCAGSFPTGSSSTPSRTTRTELPPTPAVGTAHVVQHVHRSCCVLLAGVRVRVVVANVGRAPRVPTAIRHVAGEASTSHLEHDHSIVELLAELVLEHRAHLPPCRDRLAIELQPQ